MYEELKVALMKGESEEIIEGCYEIYVRASEIPGFEYAVHVTNQWSNDFDYEYFENIEDLDIVINDLKERVK